jgi:DNA-binding transcriptional ArsR family regulator
MRTRSFTCAPACNFDPPYCQNCVGLTFCIAIWQYCHMAIRTTPTDPLSRTFAALCDPTRRAIIARLATGEATVAELMEPFDLAQPTISKHLKVLESAGLIERSKHAQTRPRQLVPVALKGIADWIEPFRQQWEGRLDNLERYLAIDGRKEKSNDKRPRSKHRR